MGNLIEPEAKSSDEYTKEYVHVCKLPREVDVISYFIPDNQKLRQWFRKQCLISPNVSHRRLCVKSYRALEQDRAIHLTTHFYIIHPFSAFRFYWELIMIIIFLMELLIIPYIIVLQYEYFLIGIWIAIAFQSIGIANICVKCMSGYFEPATRDIILEPQKIIKNYLRKYFFLDVIANFPLSLILFISGYDIIGVRASFLLNFFNVFSFLDYTERFREKRQYPLCTCRLIQFILLYLITMFWITCLIGVAAYLDQKIIFNSELWWLFLNNSFVLLFSLGQSEFVLHGYELYVHFVAIIVGFLMRNIIIAQIILLFKSYYSSKRKYMQLMSELKEFSHFKRLPKTIKERIYDYYNFVFQHYYYNETEIWNLMSDKLKYEIEKNLYKIWFEADIFKFCPPQVMQSLVVHLKKEVYLTNDVLYTPGSVCDYIYFLKCGTIVLYTENGVELAHVKEGSFFSDAALILEKDLTHETAAIAIEACEVYKLHREDFRDIIEHYPEEYKVILEILKKRRKQNAHTTTSTNDEENDS